MYSSAFTWCWGWSVTPALNKNPNPEDRRKKKPGFSVGGASFSRTGMWNKGRAPSQNISFFFGDESQTQTSAVTLQFAFDAVMWFRGNVFWQNKVNHSWKRECVKEECWFSMHRAANSPKYIYLQSTSDSLFSHIINETLFLYLCYIDTSLLLSC